MTSTCGEFVRSIQTRKRAVRLYLAQVSSRGRVRADMRKTPHRRTRRRRLARRRLHRLRPDLGARRLRHGSSGRHDVHRRRPVHRELRLHRRRRRRLHRPGRPLLGHRRPDRHRRLPDARACPNGTPVEVTGASQPGTLVYNCWNAMQAAGETDADTCAYNDFALIKLDPADHGKVNPSVPTLGGPTALGDTTATARRRLLATATRRCARASRCSRPSSARASAPPGGGWTHLVYTVTPGIPGDSGSGFMDARAARSASCRTLQLAPVAASNGVSDLPQGARLRALPRRPGRDARQRHASRSRARSSVERGRCRLDGARGAGNTLSMRVPRRTVQPCSPPSPCAP